MNLAGNRRMIHARPLGKSVAAHRMIGQMAVVPRHDRMQVVPSVEDILTPVAVSIEVPMAVPVRIDHPDIRVATDEDDVMIRRSRDIDIGRCRDISFFNDRRGHDYRLRSGRHCCDDDGIELVRIYHELTLFIRRTPREHYRACESR